ncbi:MAG: PilZ domain-containing protein [Nannocystaceae bacterium]
MEDADASEAPVEALEPRQAPTFWGHLPGQTRGLVLELERWGARLTVPRDCDLTVGAVTTFELRNETRVLVSCTARVVGLATFDLGCEVTLWVISPRERWAEAAQQLDLPTQHRVDPHAHSRKARLPPDRVSARLRALAAERCRARIWSHGRDDGPRLPARLDPERGLLVEWDPAWSELQAPFCIEVEGPFSTVTFVADSLRWDSNATPEVTTQRRRQMRRATAPSGARVILHGTDGDEPTELRLQDVSFGGVSARLPATLTTLQPGNRIPEVVVTWKGGPGLRFTGDIRHRSPAPHRNDQMIGLQLGGAADEQADRWAREVENLLYPTTKSFNHDFDSIWELFEASGYFDLAGDRRHDLDFQLMRSSFEDAYRKVSAAPELGCVVSFESPTRVEATLAGLRAWSRSWFGLHMARNRDRPHLVNSDSAPLRDIHFHVYERAGANTDLKWLVTYVRDDAGFSAALHRDFILTVPGACGVPFEVWKMSVHMVGDLDARGANEATQRQRDHVLRRLVGRRPFAYLETYDLLPETFEQEELRADWHFHGLQRDRAMFVALDRERVVAAAVLDAVQEGLHLYGLLDSVRLFELEPGGCRKFPALLTKANEWFYGVGKSSFVCFDEEGHADIMRSAGARSLGTGLTTLMPRAATPDLLERVAEITAPK